MDFTITNGISNFISYCKWRHDTYANHYYDEDNKIKYSFHLEKVANIALSYKHLIKENKPLYESLFKIYTDNNLRDWIYFDEMIHQIIEAVGWGHDILEDTRMSYNDLGKVLNQFYHKVIADIILQSIWSMTEYRGTSREERHPLHYYENIANLPFANLGKLSDIKANTLWALLNAKVPMAVKELEVIERYLNTPFCNPIFTDLKKLL